MSTIRPWSMMATRSQSRSASSMRCVVRNDGLATLPDAANQVPDRAPCLRVESGRQFVEEYQFGVVDEREGDEEALFLAARQGHEPGVSFVAQPELLDQAIAVNVGSIEGRPQADGFGNLDSLLKLRLLKLHANPLLQRVPVPSRIEPEDRDDSTIGRAQSVCALHGRRLAGAVRSDQPEYFAGLDVEGDPIDGDGAPVPLSDRRDVNDRLA